MTAPPWPAGDADYKPFVSSECDVKTLEMVGDEDFLILATDGLWDTITYEEAVTFVYAYLTINQGEQRCSWEDCGTLVITYEGTVTFL